MYKNKFKKYSSKITIIKGGYLNDDGKNIICNVCMTNNIQLLFTSCGHCVCQECYDRGRMTICHICRKNITNIIFIPEDHLDKEMDWFVEKIERYKTIEGRPYIIYRDEIGPAEMDHLTEMAIRDIRIGDRVVAAAVDTDDSMRQQRLRQIGMIQREMEQQIGELKDLKDSLDTRRREIAQYFKPITVDIDYWCDLLDQKFEKQRTERISLSEQISFCKEKLVKLADKLSNNFAEYEELNERYMQETRRFMQILTEREDFNRGLTFEDITRLPMILETPSISYLPSIVELRRYLEKGNQYLRKTE
jgi:hypothetical protein